MERCAASADHVEGNKLVVFKARRITTHVDGVSRAIGRLNTLWNDPHDARPNELDVGFSEALEPAAIILQHTLAEGRVGHHESKPPRIEG